MTEIRLQTLFWAWILIALNWLGRNMFKNSKNLGLGHSHNLSQTHHFVKFIIVPDSVGEGPAYYSLNISQLKGTSLAIYGSNKQIVLVVSFGKSPDIMSWIEVVKWMKVYSDLIWRSLADGIHLIVKLTSKLKLLFDCIM